MVLTAAQVRDFFENNGQMAIPHATVVQLENEGITTVDDLIDFDKDTLQQVADNLRRPGGRIPNPDPNAPPGSTIPQPPFTFGAKSQKRLLAACELVRFYTTIGRPLTAANMQWDPIIKNFSDQWKALEDRKSNDPPDVPKISKALPIIKWTEAFSDYLHRTIGSRVIPLAYVTRETIEVPAAVPTLAPNSPHSVQHGSVEADLIARASHTHALYREDNAKVYYYLEEATRGTSYAASIKPYQRDKDGRNAWFSLKNQYAGNDKWEAELHKQDELLHNRIWKGQSNFSLEKFIAQHRNAFVSMQQCAEHVSFQLPNEHTRVGYLLENIQTSDAGLQAAMAQVKTDDGPDGKRNDFESTAAFLLPYDPVAKKRRSQKRTNVEISDSTSVEVAAFGSKPGIGKTGVHLRYHTPEEYNKLSKKQKEELRQWRLQSKKGKSQEKKGKTGMTEKSIAAAVAKEVEKHINSAADQASEDDKARAWIMSLFPSAPDENVDASPSKKVKIASTNQPPSKPTLKSILRRAKNGPS